jgi:oligoendopeptidase F
MKTEWNLELLYKSAKDPLIEKDIVSYERAVSAFEKKYKNKKDYLTHDKKLHAALVDYEKLYSAIGARKPMEYFYYRTVLNAEDKEAEAQANLLTQRLSKAQNKIIFFEITLGKVDTKKQNQFLKTKTLEHFRYFLYVLFKSARYNLSEPEEKILNLKALPSYTLWVQGQQKLLSQQTVDFQGSKVPIPEAMNKMSELPTEERRKLSDSINEVLKNISHFAESEMNAVYINKKIGDELRGYKEPYSATILGYQNDEKSVINFVETVTKNFKISHAFYDIKKKLLNVDHLEYADRSADVGKINIKLDFKKSSEVFTKALKKLDPRFVTIYQTYLEKGQIDVYPKKGKRGGAFCSSSIGMPTFVLLNHVDNIDSYKTLAHEMGHAIHAEFSKTQTPLYEGHTISVAEVASTLFENFAFDEVFPLLSKKEQIIALHDRVNDAIATVFRQIAAFNFELDLHKTIRAQGSISKEQIVELHNKNMKAYLGPSFNLKELDGYMFVQWPHLRYFFYVYSYAYGELISKALYRKYKQDPSYIKEIEKFLSAGGSKSPEKIFKDIGIDTSKPQFFVEGLKAIEADIKKLAELTN